MKEYICKEELKKWVSKNIEEPNGALKITFVNNQIDKLPTITKADIRAEVFDEILNICGGGTYECDCDLCIFAIFECDIRVGCEILGLKEQGNE